MILIFLGSSLTHLEPKLQLEFTLENCQKSLIDDLSHHRLPKFKQITESGRFWVQKIGSSNQKTDTTFCRQLYPKMVDDTLVSYEYHYWVSFGQILKMAYFGIWFPYICLGVW